MENVFKKGEVWLVGEDKRISAIKEELHDNTSRYTRQYLIVSNDENLNGDWDNFITCIPLTYHKADIKYWSNVLLRDQYGCQCKLLCKELHTLDRKRFIKRTFTISDGQMRLVEKIISSNLISVFDNRNDNADEIAALQFEIAELQKRVQELQQPSTRKPYHKWTPENVREFLHDSVFLDIEVCLKKYDLTYDQFLNTRRYCIMKRNAFSRYNI